MINIGSEGPGDGGEVARNGAGRINSGNTVVVSQHNVRDLRICSMNPRG